MGSIHELLKSVVRAHTSHTKSGKLALVKQYANKVQKKLLGHATGTPDNAVRYAFSPHAKKKPGRITVHVSVGEHNGKLVKMPVEATELVPGMLAVHAPAGMSGKNRGLVVSSINSGFLVVGANDTKGLTAADLQKIFAKREIPMTARTMFTHENPRSIIQTEQEKKEMHEYIVGIHTDMHQYKADKAAVKLDETTFKSYGLASFASNTKMSKAKVTEIANHVQQAIDTICDVIDVPKNVFGKNKMHLRIESAGKLGRGVLGSYDPPVKTLKILKNGQALAHEWTHAMDHLIMDRPDAPFTFSSMSGDHAGHRLAIVIAEDTELRQRCIQQSMNMPEPWRSQNMRYQTDPIEMVARTMEAYIYYTGKQKGIPDETLWQCVTRNLHTSPRYPTEDEVKLLQPFIKDFLKEAGALVHKAFLRLFSKSVVKQHVSHSKTGKQFVVHEHTDKRTKKHDQTETPEFKKWFAGSKVVDKQEKPLRMYHGTREPMDFQRFKTNTKKELGAHFGSTEQANEVSRKGGNIFPVYLKIAKPLRLIDEKNWSASVVANQLRSKVNPVSGKINEKGLDLIDQETALKLHYGELKLQETIKNIGYDGIVYLNRGEGLGNLTKDEVEWLRANADKVSDDEFRKKFPQAHDSYIVFSPTQIKSAIGNRGTFDPNNPNIIKSVVKHG